MNFNKDICTICGSTEFYCNGNDHREDFRCNSCHSQTRVRYLKFVLDNSFPHWKDLIVHESSPASNTFFKNSCVNYSSSFYNLELLEGGIYDSSYNLNLENLYLFEDNSFDLFITQDVFEHVYQPDIAFREIQRVLKPGGAHIFTVPRSALWKNTKFRIKLDNKEIIYIEEPIYHLGLTGTNSLVTIDYGQDFEKVFYDWTNTTLDTNSIIVNDRTIEVFIQKK